MEWAVWESISTTSFPCLWEAEAWEAWEEWEEWEEWEAAIHFSPQAADEAVKDSNSGWVDIYALCC